MGLLLKYVKKQYVVHSVITFLYFNVSLGEPDNLFIILNFPFLSIKLVTFVYVSDMKITDLF